MEAIEGKGTTTLPSLPNSGQAGEQQQAQKPPVQVGDGPLRVICLKPTRCSATSARRNGAYATVQGRSRTHQSLGGVDHFAGVPQAAGNRENEVLAGAAEKASLGAALAGRAGVSIGKAETTPEAGDGRPVP